MQENINFTISREGIKVCFHRDHSHRELQPSDLSNSTFKTSSLHKNEQNSTSYFIENPSTRIPSNETFPYQVATIVQDGSGKQTTLKIKTVKCQKSQFNIYNNTNESYYYGTDSEYFGDSEQNKTSDSFLSEDKSFEITSEYEADDEDVGSEVSKASSSWGKRCYNLLRLLLDKTEADNKKVSICKYGELPEDCICHCENFIDKMPSRMHSCNPSKIFDSEQIHSSGKLSLRKEMKEKNLDSGSNYLIKTDIGNKSKQRIKRQSDSSPHFNMFMTMMKQSDEDNEATKKFKRCWNEKRVRKSSHYQLHTASDEHANNYGNDDQTSLNERLHPSRHPLFNHNKPAIKPAPRRSNIQNPSKYMLKHNNLKCLSRKHNTPSYNPLHSISRHKNLFMPRSSKKNIYEDKDYYDSLPHSSQQIHSLECLEKVKQSLMDRKRNHYGHIMVHKPIHYFVPVSNENINYPPKSDISNSFGKYSSNYDDINYSSFHSESYDRSEENVQSDGMFSREDSDQQEIYPGFRHKEKSSAKKFYNNKYRAFENAERDGSSNVPTSSTKSAEWDSNPVMLNRIVLPVNENDLLPDNNTLNRTNLTVSKIIDDDHVLYSENQLNETTRMTRYENQNHIPILNNENADHGLLQERNSLETPKNNLSNNTNFASNIIKPLYSQQQTSTAGGNNMLVQESSNILNPVNFHDIYQNLPKDYELSAGQWIHIQPSSQRENVQRSVNPTQIDYEEPKQNIDQQNKTNLDRKDAPFLNSLGNDLNIKGAFQNPPYDLFTNTVKYPSEYSDGLASKARSNNLGQEQREKFHNTPVVNNAPDFPPGKDDNKLVHDSQSLEYRSSLVPNKKNNRTFRERLSSKPMNQNVNQMEFPVSDRNNSKSSDLNDTFLPDLHPVFIPSEESLPKKHYNSYLDKSTHPENNTSGESYSDITEININSLEQNNEFKVEQRDFITEKSFPEEENHFTEKCLHFVENLRENCTNSHNCSESYSMISDEVTKNCSKLHIENKVNKCKSNFTPDCKKNSSVIVLHKNLGKFISDSQFHDSTETPADVSSEDFFQISTTIRSTDSETLPMDTASPSTVTIFQPTLTLLSSKSSQNNESMGGNLSVPYNSYRRAIHEDKPSIQKSNVERQNLVGFSQDPEEKHLIVSQLDNKFQQNNEKYYKDIRNNNPELKKGGNLEMADPGSLEYNYSGSNDNELKDNIPNALDQGHTTKDINYYSTSTEGLLTTSYSGSMSKETFSIRSDEPEYSGSLFLLNPNNGEVTHSIPVTGKLVSPASELMTTFPQESISYPQYPTETTLMPANYFTTPPNNPTLIGQSFLPHYSLTNSKHQQNFRSSLVLNSIYNPKELLQTISLPTSTPSLVTAIHKNFTCESAYKQYIYKYFIRVLLKEYLDELSKNHEHHCSHNCTEGKPSHVCDECIKQLIKEQKQDETTLVQKIKLYNSQHCQNQLNDNLDNLLTENHPCTIYSKCKFDVLSSILEKIGKWLKII